MTFRRLLDNPEDDFETALLGSAQFDLPSDADVRRGVLSIAAVGGAVSLSSAAAALDGGSRALGAVSSHAAATAAVLKWLGIGFTAGLVTTGGGAIVAHRLSASRPPVAGHSSTVAAANVAPARVAGAHAVAEVDAPGLVPAARFDELISPPVASSRDVSSRAIADVARVERVARSAARRSETAAHPSTSVVAPLASDDAAPAITAELAALSDARLALSAGDPERVLRGLDAYDHLARTHVLDNEAAMLRIEALVQAGRTVEASRFAASYLSQHPHSPNRSRLEQIAGAK